MDELIEQISFALDVIKDATETAQELGDEEMVQQLLVAANEVLYAKRRCASAITARKAA